MGSRRRGDPRCSRDQDRGRGRGRGGGCSLSGGTILPKGTDHHPCGEGSASLPGEIGIPTGGIGIPTGGISIPAGRDQHPCREGSASLPGGISIPARRDRHPYGGDRHPSGRHRRPCPRMDRFPRKGPSPEKTVRSPSTRCRPPRRRAPCTRPRPCSPCTGSRLLLRLGTRSRRPEMKGILECRRDRAAQASTCSNTPGTSTPAGGQCAHASMAARRCGCHGRDELGMLEVELGQRDLVPVQHTYLRRRGPPFPDPDPDPDPVRASSALAEAVTLCRYCCGIASGGGVPLTG